MDTAMTRVSPQRGFGLVEVIISMALGLVIILGVTQLFSSANRTLMTVEEVGRQAESSVFAAEILAADLRLAGYWGEAKFPLFVDDGVIRAGEMVEDSTPADRLIAAKMPPNACLGTALSGFYDASSPTAIDTDQRAFFELAYGVEYPVYSTTGGLLNLELGFSNSGEAGGTDICKAGSTAADPGSEAIAVRRASTCSLGETGCAPVAAGEFYVQTNGCRDETMGLDGGELRLSNDQDDLDYPTFECDSSITAPIYRYMSRVYYVSNDASLMRLQLGVGSDGLFYQSERLVDGVELMRFEWGVDTDGDGTPDLISRAPTLTEWPNVVSVTIWLLVRSPDDEPISAAAQTTKFLIAGEEYIPADANYRRMVQTRTVELVNIAGRRR